MHALDHFLVSVVIPCYRHARFLPDAVESIVRQTYPFTEIVIVNDGSPDDTLSVARNLIHRYPHQRMKVVDKPNGGLADARNAGLAAASSSWILPLDADDSFERTFIEKAIQAVRTNPQKNLIFTDVQTFGARTDRWVPIEYSMERLKYCNSFPYASLYPKELWRRTGGYERALPWGAEDFSFWIGCSQVGIDSFRIPGALFNYRAHPEGSMMTGLLAHFSLVEGMIFTLHAHLYPAEIVLAAHSRIAGLDEATLQILDDKDRLFEDLAFTHLWRGLYYERQLNFEGAIAEYDLFDRKHFRPDWQTMWRRLFCLVSLGRERDARNQVYALKERHPTFPFADQVIESMKSLPPCRLESGGDQAGA